MSQSIKWIVLLSLLVLATTLLFLGGPETQMPRSLRHLWNLGHIAYYFLIGLLLARLPFIARMSRGYRIASLLTITLCSGIYVEYLQYGSLRQPDINDVWRDFLGCLLFLVYDASLWIQIKRMLRRLAAALVLLLLLFQMQPFFIAVVDEVVALYQFPLLANFETPYEQDRFGGSAVLDVIPMENNKENNVLSVYFGTDRYSGVRLQHFPSDFTGYNRLNFKLFNPSEDNLRVTLRVHDQSHELGKLAYMSFDRYSRRFLLTSGWNQLEIDLDDIRMAPKMREMDLTQLTDITLFVSRLPLPRQLLIAEIGLSRL